MHRTCLRIGQKEIFHDSHWHLVSYWTTLSPRSPHPLLDILLVRLGVGSRIPVQYRPVLIYYSGRFWDMTRRHEGIIRLATVHEGGTAQAVLRVRAELRALGLGFIFYMTFFSVVMPT